MAQFRFDVAMQRLTELAPGLGAMHVGELPFVFNPEDTTPVMIEKELAVSKEMQLVWIGFANNDADIFTTKNTQFTFTDDQAKRNRRERLVYIQGDVRVPGHGHWML
jgi:carboxylesterase type B